jgi:F-type H+-transporting ATPase subunit epsilon
MRLKVLLPVHVLLDVEAERVVAESEHGSFGILPRHIDFVAALTPGLLTFTPVGGEEEYVAVDEGVLVKQGAEVLVSVRNAVRGHNLGDLRHTVEETFEVVDDRERRARSALARLEAGFVRRFLELSE